MVEHEHETGGRVPPEPREAFLLAGAFRVICRNPRFVTELADRGLRVLVLTPESSRPVVERARAVAPGITGLIADIRYVSGAMDREASFNADAFAALQEWRVRHRIVGAYAMEEMLVEPTGLICDALGLPGPGLRASRVCRSKYLQRAYARTFGPLSLTVPPGRRDRVDLASLTCPVVVKPAARHASSGVVACATADEVARALRDYPAHETILIERQVIGEEFSVESLVQDGEIRFASVTGKETTEDAARSFVELAHSVPVGERRIGGTDVTRAVTEANRRVLAALAFENGVAHSEWRVTDTGETHLMEIACRTPGDGLTALYELACGEPLEPQIIRVALGEPAAFPAPRRRARQVYLDHPPGVLRDVTVDLPGARAHWVGEGGLWPEPSPGVPGDPPALRAVLVLKERGAVIGPLRSSDDRAVTFLIDADTPAELDAMEKRARAAIAVRVDPVEPVDPVDPVALEAPC
ncbi:ATP-grasp domain-containing protein [Streptomyces radicis]|uniref:ATP-grasp domain-containing protein n=1 Tax=Streptomyces radicis TaxID=1750517 RepID=A0A3A9VTU9_9ACTN|nr:ATP-grasp domain-containing protein [Streptomyces radicis]RKN04511.1 ATP-grasp domain-containing protein [Streptomyces radicis]RKN15489.1 ATP-grasp domain-containing protein [Streptomyces radicis]